MPFVQDQAFINFIDSLSELELNQFLKTEPFNQKEKSIFHFKTTPTIEKKNL